MKNILIKYANLTLIFVLLLLPLRLRAVVLWFLFNLKQKFL